MENTIVWDAQEFIEQARNKWWYIGVVGVGVGLGVLAAIMQWWMFLVLVVLSVIVLILSGVKPPRTIHYILDNQGLMEGKRLYKFDDFKAFGIMKEKGDNFALFLMPKKRFAPSIKAYFLENDGEKIANFLGERLPAEEIKLDFLDKIINFLHI